MLLCKHAEHIVMLNVSSRSGAHQSTLLQIHRLQVRLGGGEVVSSTDASATHLALLLPPASVLLEPAALQHAILSTACSATGSVISGSSSRGGGSCSGCGSGKGCGSGGSAGDAVALAAAAEALLQRLAAGSIHCVSAGCVCLHALSCITKLEPMRSESICSKSLKLRSATPWWSSWGANAEAVSATCQRSGNAFILEAASTYCKSCGWRTPQVGGRSGQSGVARHRCWRSGSTPAFRGTAAEATAEPRRGSSMLQVAAVAAITYGMQQQLAAQQCSAAAATLAEGTAVW